MPILMHNVKEKMSKVIRKERIIKQAKNRTFKLRPMLDFNQMQWQLKDKSNMMLEKEWAHACSLKCFP